MNPTRRNSFKLLGLALALASIGLPATAAGDDDDDGYRAGKVFTSTNGAGGNELLVYGSGAGGALTLLASLPTHGLGTGGGLGNAGAITLSGNKRFLFVVNAASNTVSTFAIRRNGLTLVSNVDSGGLRPVSVTEHDGLVYVLNAEGAGNVAGFRNHGGTLTPLADSVRGLSAAGGTGPAQVGFSPEGDVLVVTEKATNKLTTYRVLADGRIGAPLVTASSGVTPFGFAFNERGTLLVSDAAGGAPGASTMSSYVFSGQNPISPVSISPAVPTLQTAACWVVVTPNGRYAYTTNTGSDSISSYAVHKSGQIALAHSVAAAAGDAPIDAAISASGNRLYVLNAASHTISTFTIGKDGSLHHPGSVGGLPVGANGMAAN